MNEIERKVINNWLKLNITEGGQEGFRFMPLGEDVTNQFMIKLSSRAFFSC